MANLPDYYVAARKLEGLREIVGSQHERQVVDFFADAGHSWVKDDETAWCAAFENAMLARTGWKGTGKLTARSFLDWGTPVRTEDAQEGDIVVIPRGTSAWEGHVTMFVRWANEAKTSFVGFGGNQRNAVREDTYKAKILGVRRPSERLVEKAEDRLYQGMPKNKRVEAMQSQLTELGYHVGDIDGRFGNLTRDAVLAWKADNGIPLSPEVSPQDLNAMEASKPRPLAAKRAMATTAEVKAADKSVKHDDAAVKTAAGTAVVVAGPTVLKETGMLEALKGAKEQVGVAKDIVSQVTDGAKTIGVDVAAFISSHSTLLLIGGMLVVAYFVWKSMKAKVNDHREGRTL